MNAYKNPDSYGDTSPERVSIFEDETVTLRREAHGS